MSSDAVIIPPTSYAPQQNMGDTIQSLTVVSAASVDLAGYDLALNESLSALSVAGTIRGPGRIVAANGSKVTLKTATTLPNLFVGGSAIFNMNGQTLTVEGNLEQGDLFTSFSGGGTAVVYGNTTLRSNQAFTGMPSLDLKGNLTTGGCILRPCTLMSTPLSLSGASHQNVLIMDASRPISSAITARAGSDVTFTTGNNVTLQIIGSLDLSGNFTIPAGTSVNIQRPVILHSGSTTTVLGTLTFASCSKDVLDVTYSGFSCQ